MEKIELWDQYSEVVFIREGVKELIPVDYSRSCGTGLGCCDESLCVFINRWDSFGAALLLPKRVSGRN